MAPEGWIERLRERFDSRLPGADYLTWMSYASLKTNLVEDYLARLDKLAMRESVEGRVPLLDPMLVRWAFGVPQEQKVRRFEQKALFRRAVSHVVPAYVTERPKQGFCPPVAGWASNAPRRLTERFVGASGRGNHRAVRCRGAAAESLDRRCLRALDARHADGLVRSQSLSAAHSRSNIAWTTCSGTPATDIGGCRCSSLSMRSRSNCSGDEISSTRPIDRRYRSTLPISL